MSADIQSVLKRADAARIGLSLMSPLEALVPRYHADPVKGNRTAMNIIADNTQIMMWVVVHPLVPETFDQAKEMLQHDHCIGIKIHPEEHGYHITKHGNRIFEFASRNKAIIETHSGEANSLPADYLPFVNDFPDVRLILSHLGCGSNDKSILQVDAIQNSKHGNVFTDTSSSASLMPGLLEWAVRQIGAERILFGTDSPCYFSPMQRARVDYADISYENKKSILRDNAIKLFGNKLSGVMDFLK
jgi:predicted TIM-barrel fold metal-dependent hydrolase